ncbi:hypothetical protein PHYSODRAFT_354584 [Phytophthora sojae]|uniref:HTH CENPB-type domain-containing protein n=1 Tax=Phytophthora sojae (strain P6497) TaxID=1094619 RepID=G4ZEV6_PHYSP|nr:hypothetical protein PHYSODRAFT_354584 [Phytophthora sojae]EGZ17452.1 hypothetical protein PHYSODRAFT_354584 [Phytophthora sojae]|eukprot:XP_009526510.1 hypothetical protein PHYSODRAFT_354584 [Phytophthora sojae]
MPRTAKKTYIRLTLGQKVMLCQRAHELPGTLKCLKRQALREWATKEFDLPQPMSERTLDTILKSEATLLQVSETNYRNKRVADPVLEEFDRALLAEFDRLCEPMTEKSLMARGKLLWEARFSDLPAEKRPGFSKGWAYRFRKRHGKRKLDEEAEAASVEPSSTVDGANEQEL